MRERGKADDARRGRPCGTASDRSARAGAASGTPGSRTSPPRTRSASSSSRRARCARASRRRRVGAAEEPREQGNRQKRHRRCANACCHECVTRGPHNISGSIATTAVPLAYGCHVSKRPGKMPASSGTRVPLAAPLLETRLNGLAPHRQGKVRDIFDLGDSLLMVATDRISAFDYVLGSGIPDKGKVLTQLSAFWFERTAAHRAEPPADARTSATYPAELRPPRRHARAAARCSCRKTNPVPIECVARGYLSGSGWKEYQATGRGLRRRAAAGPARIGSAARADLHAGHQGRRAATT